MPYEFVGVKDERTVIKGPLTGEIKKIENELLKIRDKFGDDEHAIPLATKEDYQKWITKNVLELMQYIDPNHFLGHPSRISSNFLFGYPIGKNTKTLIYIPDYVPRLFPDEGIRQCLDLKVLDEPALSLQLSFSGLNRIQGDLMTIHKFMTQKYSIDYNERGAVVINPVMEGGFFVESLRKIWTSLRRDESALDALSRTTSSYTPIDYKLRLLKTMGVK